MFYECRDLHCSLLFPTLREGGGCLGGGGSVHIFVLRPIIISFAADSRRLRRQRLNVLDLHVSISQRSYFSSQELF